MTMVKTETVGARIVTFACDYCHRRTRVLRFQDGYTDLPKGWKTVNTEHYCMRQDCQKPEGG